MQHEFINYFEKSFENECLFPDTLVQSAAPVIQLSNEKKEVEQNLQDESSKESSAFDDIEPPVNNDSLLSSFDHQRQIGLNLLESTPAKSSHENNTTPDQAENNASKLNRDEEVKYDFSEDNQLYGKHLKSFKVMRIIFQISY